LSAAPARVWQTTRVALDLTQPLVMGIVNVTPDSFSDGGHHADERAALGHCEALLRDGADLLDIGGESTRPGAPVVPVDEELRRVLPVLRGALGLGVPVSVDTRKPEVVEAALALGVDIVNDVSALRDMRSLRALAAHPGAGVILMHMKGEPDTMQSQARYDDVVLEVRDALSALVERAGSAGVDLRRIAVDPGYGFAKTAAQSWQLLAGQAALAALGRPLVAGLSRKSMLGAATGRAVDQRLAASVAAAVLAAERGAAVLRVHDVAATVDALKVWGCVRAALPAQGR
jgi:dihydropteroate synthase